MFCARRLRGDILNKASRGELKNPLPIGLVYDSQDRVVLEPDQQVQQAIRTLSATFARTGSASATVKFFRQQGWLFPRRLRRGVHKGQFLWVPLVTHRVLQVLHNPRYAGAFFHRRVHSRKDENGHRLYQTLPMEQWHVCCPKLTQGTSPWEQYQHTATTARQCPSTWSRPARKSCRRGTALLQAWSCADLRPTHDRALSHALVRIGANVPLPKAGHRAWSTALPGSSRRWSRSGHRRTALGVDDPRGVGGGTGGTTRTAGTYGRRGLAPPSQVERARYQPFPVSDSCHGPVSPFCRGHRALSSQVVLVESGVRIYSNATLLDSGLESVHAPRTPGRASLLRQTAFDSNAESR